MSDQERFDWDDDMDFESLADEHSLEDSSLEDLSDFEENADSAPPAMDVSAKNEKKTSPKKARSSFGKKLGISGSGLGLMYAISVLVAGVGLGGGVIFVTGVDPLSLWNPQGLMQVDQWLNFETYPMNLLYFLTGGILSLGLLGSWVLAKTARTAEDRYQSSNYLLEQMVALRLDNEDAWQNPDFKSDPQVAAFVAETLGSWRLQMARQKKSINQEGELVRLQKAMEAKSRDDLVGQYENQSVGNLADAVVQLFDEGEAARNESKSLRKKDEHQSREFMGVVQDARSWNKSARDKMSQQGVAVDKLTTQLAELGSLAGKLSAEQDQKKAAQVVADITREFEIMSANSSVTEQLTQMNSLIDRGSKLAFQMAMEVARLGTRGERLLPMTQSLEELSNEFRQVTKGLGEGGDDHKNGIITSLNQVQAELTQDPGQAVGHMTEVVGKLIPSVNQVSQNLMEVAQSFSHQGDRLTRLGEGLSSYTGVQFKAEDLSEGNADNPPEGALNLTQHDPFAATAPVAEPVTDVDPFSQADNLLSGQDDAHLNSGFQTTVTPGQDEDYPEPQAALPTNDEKVYDLSEFGAVAIDESAVTNPETESIIESVLEVEAEVEGEKIYDLAEFGAVCVT